MITREEIEQARSPAQWREFVALKRKQVEENPEELAKGLRKSGLYKMFVDEIMPLAVCAEHLCGPDDLLQPVYGNQGYDAIVTDSERKEKGRVEITNPFDGKANADDVKLLEKRGYGEFRLRKHGKGLANIAPRIIKIAKEKSMKDYSDATLLLVATIDPPYSDEIPILERDAQLLCGKLQKICYKARRVILVVPSIEKSYIIQG